VTDAVLTDEELAVHLDGSKALGWSLVDGQLVKTVDCTGFVGSLAFVTDVAGLAEEANHHPDIDIRYNQVTLRLVSHDSGGITTRDIDLARRIDQVRSGVR
jgi:4a-hydroxytetrahydrobiopterin dehydratase